MTVRVDLTYDLTSDMILLQICDIATDRGIFISKLNQYDITRVLIGKERGISFKESRKSIGYSYRNDNFFTLNRNCDMKNHW